MAKIDKKLLDDLKNIKEKNIDRYYQSIQLVLGLYFYLQNNPDFKIRFVGAEIDLKRTSEDNKLTPDAVFQYEHNGTIGIPIEIKSSISTEMKIFQELKEMERYDEELIGWDTSNKKVDEHIIVFAPHFDDGGRVKRIYLKSLKEKKLKFDKDFFIFQWVLEISTKFGKTEVLGIQNIEGTNTNKELNDFIEKATDNISYDITDPIYVEEKEINLFTRKKPPIQYLMVHLWNPIFPKFYKKEFMVVKIDELVKVMNENFNSTLMINPHGESFKIRIKWVKEALELFEKIRLAKKLNENEYEIFYDKMINNKDYEDYICEKLSRLEIRQGHSEDLQILRSRNLPSEPIKEQFKEFKEV